jgi:hypothetical protein
MCSPIGRPPLRDPATQDCLLPMQEAGLPRRRKSHDDPFHAGPHAGLSHRRLVTPDDRRGAQPMAI